MKPSLTVSSCFAGRALAPSASTDAAATTVRRTAPPNSRFFDIVRPFSRHTDLTRTGFDSPGRRLRSPAVAAEVSASVVAAGRAGGCFLSVRSLATSHDQGDDLLVGLGARSQLADLAAAPQHDCAVGDL